MTSIEMQFYEASKDQNTFSFNKIFDSYLHLRTAYFPSFELAWSPPTCHLLWAVCKSRRKFWRNHWTPAINICTPHSVIKVRGSSDLITVSNIPGNDSSLLDYSDELGEGLRHNGAGKHAGTAQQHVVGVVSDLELFSSLQHRVEWLEWQALQYCLDLTTRSWETAKKR